MKDIYTEEETELQALYKKQSEYLVRKQMNQEVLDVGSWLHSQYQGKKAENGLYYDAGGYNSLMTERLRKNPNDKNATEYLEKYALWKGLKANQTSDFWGTPVDMLIENVQKEINEKQLLLQRVKKQHDTLDHKAILTQARNTNIADSGIYERMFGDNKKKASALEAEFKKLRKTTFEALKDVDFDRLAQFMNGSLAARNSAGGAGTGLTELAKQQDTITGGGKNVKNININLQNLIGTNNNNFQPGETPQQADNFMQKLSDALQLVLNDANGTD